MSDANPDDQQCHCPESYPDWHQKDIDLGGSTVHRLKIASFMYMPLSFDTYLERQYKDIQELELQETYPDIVLSRTGFWGGEIIRILEPAQSPSRYVDTLPLSFQLRGYLHNGGIGTIKEATRALQMELFDLGRMPKELYLVYLTCPICADRKGGDKILLLRRWRESPTLAKRIKR